jgi:hypothetical protein
MNTSLHWNYFLALEKDLQAVSRYIEFCQPNMQVFSVELAHLLFAAASEIDAIAKCACKIIDPKAKCGNIDAYRKIITKAAEDETYPCSFGEKVRKVTPRDKHCLSAIHVCISHHNIAFIPWQNWAKDSNPDWWHSYNEVKHQRNDHFNQATLHNAIYALGGLLALNYYYCRLLLTKDKPDQRYHCRLSRVTSYLEPRSTFLTLGEEYYANSFDEIASIVKQVCKYGMLET